MHRNEGLEQVFADRSLTYYDVQMELQQLETNNSVDTLCWYWEINQRSSGRPHNWSNKSIFRKQLKLTADVGAAAISRGIRQRRGN